MVYILLSISCSLLVAILLKLAKRYEVDVKQAIVWNYAIAISLTVIFLKPPVNNLPSSESAWSIYILLGLLLPGLFVVIASSIKKTGIVRTDIAQRLSLLLPILAAFFLYNEASSPLKLAGISLGLISIACSISWKSNEKATSSGWPYLITVFIGMGIIDILFKQIALLKVAPFSVSLLVVYSISFAAGLLGLFYLLYIKKVKIRSRHFFAGMALGTANFGNILFYLKAHQSESSRPSLVFSAMNIGVIAVGSLIGLWFFNEKLSILNKLGILVAIVSILLISFS